MAKRPKKTTKAFKKVPRGDFPRYLNTDYLGAICLFKPAYYSNHKLFRRSCFPKHEPQFVIRWCNPEAHCILKKTRQAYHLPAHQACRFKLHHMRLLNSSRFSPPYEPLLFDPHWTDHLMPYFLTEYPDLDDPNHTQNYIQKEYDKHLSDQIVLSQIEALEMMASCHHRFQMSDLLLDLRARAVEFAKRESCLCQHSEKYETKLQMQAKDLCALARGLLGRAFHPTIRVGDDKGELLFHEIDLYFNHLMQPIKVKKAGRHNCGPNDLVTF